MTNIESVLKEFQNELQKTNIDDFYLMYIDSKENLLLTGSFDFCYYHNVEIIFHNVSFICCPTTNFMINYIRIATKYEIDKMNQIMYGVQNEESIFTLVDTFSNINYYIVADTLEYHFETVKYNEISNDNGHLKISEWAKERILL